MNNEMTGQELKTERTKVFGLQHKDAAILCYIPVLLLSVIAPIVILKTEPANNRWLRFHAIQALVLSLAAIVLGVANSILMPVFFSIFGFGALHLMGLISTLISIAFLAATIFGIYCVYKGQEYKLPVIGDIAEANA